MKPFRRSFAPEPPAAPALPVGVIARYLTTAGAALADPTITVTVTERDSYPDRYGNVCAGCGHSDKNRFEDRARDLAQKHAATCTALPAPRAGGAQ